MKIRNCFVSNSSSSSFVVIGFSEYENLEKIKDILLKLYTKEELDQESNKYYEMSFDELNDDNITDFVQELSLKNKNGFTLSYYNEYYYVGIIGEEIKIDDKLMPAITKLKETFPDKSISIFSQEVINY